MKRVYVHVDPQLLGDPEGRPLRVWHVERGTVARARRVLIHGPSVVVHDAARGIVDPEGRGARVWVETNAEVELSR